MYYWDMIYYMDLEDQKVLVFKEGFTEETERQIACLKANLGSEFTEEMEAKIRTRNEAILESGIAKIREEGAAERQKIIRQRDLKRVIEQEFEKISQGLSAFGLSSEQINEFILWLESGDEKHLPKKE